MPTITCVKCNKSFLKNNPDKPELCGTCKVNLEQELNTIDRENDRYTARGKLKNRLYNIPDDAIPEDLALMIEEVADPEIKNRQYKLGRLDELTKISKKEIHDIENQYTMKDQGKIVLKKRFR